MSGMNPGARHEVVICNERQPGPDPDPEPGPDPGPGPDPDPDLDHGSDWNRDKLTATGDTSVALLVAAGSVAIAAVCVGILCLVRLRK